MSSGVQPYFHKGKCRILVRPELDGTATAERVPYNVEAYAYRDALLEASPELRDHHASLVGLVAA